MSRLFDVSLAVALTVAAVAELVARGTGDLPLGVVAVGVALGTLALIWRRSWPLPVALVTYVSVLGPVLAGLDDNNTGQFLAYLISAYSLGSHARGWQAQPVAIGSWVLAVAVGVGLAATQPQLPVADAVGMLVLVFGVASLGRALRRRTDTVDDLLAESRRSADEREQREARAVAEERVRISRELHDIVGHAVSLMTLQAGAARKTIHSDPARTESMLLSAESTGRQALAEMKRLVGMMRTVDHPAELAPQPALSQLPELVERTRETGLAICYEVHGTPVEVSTGLGLSAYRIVQEALTNCLKHAQASRAEVCVRYDTNELSVSVTDDGCATGDTWPPREWGHGVAGMRERVQLYDGRLRISPHAPHGLEVEAVFPL